MKPVTVLAVGGLGLLGLVLLLKPKSGPIGNESRVGDVVHVSVNSLPPGSLPAVIPQGAGFVGVRVTSASKDTLSGPIVAFVVSETPLQQFTIQEPGLGGGVPIVVRRDQVNRVFRNGAPVA